MRLSRPFVTGRYPAARCLLALLACVFFCRALIPAGYMPDTDALREGRIVLALCTADGGVRSVALDLGLDDESTTVSLDCPFGPSFSLAFVPPLDALLPVARRGGVHWSSPWVPGTRPPQPALGPPLGSRAPPIQHLT